MPEKKKEEKRRIVGYFRSVSYDKPLVPVSKETMSRRSRKKDLGPETSLVQENQQANSFLSFPKCKKWKHKTVHGVGHRPVTREFERNLAITAAKPVKARSLRSYEFKERKKKRIICEY